MFENPDDEFEVLEFIKKNKFGLYYANLQKIMKILF